MDKKKTRFNTNLPNDLIERIDAYKEAHYLPSRNAAIIVLADKQLDQEGFDKPEKEGATETK